MLSSDISVSDTNTETRFKNILHRGETYYAVGSRLQLIIATHYCLNTNGAVVTLCVIIPLGLHDKSEQVV